MCFECVDFLFIIIDWQNYSHWRRLEKKRSESYFVRVTRPEGGVMNKRTRRDNVVRMLSVVFIIYVVNVCERPWAGGAVWRFRQ